ncbi:MAG: pyridoxine 5'-phosphate synthase [Calditrichia bacterium]
MNKRLSIAIDDLALLRHMLNDSDFDPVQFAVMCEIAGAQGISMILAEDPRCLQERDAQLVKRVRKTFLNLRIPLEPQSVKNSINGSSGYGDVYRIGQIRRHQRDACFRRQFAGFPLRDAAGFTGK